MHAAPVSHGSGGVVVSHIDITDWVHDNPQGGRPETAA
jgi:hypothetical protein